MALVEGGISYSYPSAKEPGGGVGDFEARKSAVGLTGTFVEPNRHRNKSFLLR